MPNLCAGGRLQTSGGTSASLRSRILRDLAVGQALRFDELRTTNYDRKQSQFTIFA
jgi:hypothetical protein